MIKHYCPSWQEPADNGRDWVQCLCAWHAESRRSAAVSFKHNAYKCLGCDAKGDAIGLIRREEGISYQQAVRFLQEILTGSDNQVPPSTDRQPSRDLPPKQGVVPLKRGGSEVSTGIRGRSPRRT